MYGIPDRIVKITGMTVFLGVGEVSVKPKSWGISTLTILQLGKFITKENLYFRQIRSNIKVNGRLRIEHVISIKCMDNVDNFELNQYRWISTFFPQDYHNFDSLNF